MTTLWQVAEEWELFTDLFDRTVLLNDDNISEFIPEKGDAVVLWGGPDIDPKLYLDIALGFTAVQEARDILDMIVLRKAADLCIPVFGVCRGMQLIAAYAGGSLIQHADGHDGDDHSITIDAGNNPNWHERMVLTNSLHHQMVRAYHGEITILAACEPALSHRHLTGPKTYPAACVNREVEAIKIADFGMYGVQFHPEYPDAPASCVAYAKYLFHRMMKESIWK